MPSPFPPSRAELMTADGRFLAVGPGGGGRARVLLARELCAFERFEPAGVGRSAALAAARLYARTAGPFVNPGVTIRKAGSGLGIWWWDQDVVAAALKARFGTDRAPVAPETLAQPAGDGWRVVKGASGYEAQLWRDGDLVASSWRRAPFADSDWAAFTRMQRGETQSAPASPPPALTLPLTPSMAFGFSPLRDVTAGEAAMAAGAVAALAIAAFGAFQLGQGLRHADRAREAERRLATAAPAAPFNARDRRDAERLAGYRALAGRPRPLETLGVALAVLRRNGVEPQGFDADASGLTLVLPYAAITQTEQLARELAATGVFAEVRPTTQAGRKALELRLTPKGAATPAG
jgi:hypothetical protein